MEYLPDPRKMGGAGQQDRLGNPNHQQPLGPIRDVGGPWLWPTGTDPVQIDSVYLAKWLGTIGCVTPDRARDRIEPYALRRDTGTYYSAVAQEAHQRAAE